MYYTLNDRIASHFFRPEFAGRPVYLYLTDDIIEELGAPFGGGLNNFIEALKIGPPGVTREGLCQKAHQAFEHWRTMRKREYPPYVAYLGLFVLAAGKEGDYAPNAYYPRLWTLLGEPGKTGTLPSFHLMSELWNDLERWSNHDRRGELGVFNVQVAGGWIHVGIPISQTILSQHERKELSRIFADAGLDPTSQPPDLEFVRLLKLFGAHKLRPRTRKLLTRPRDETDIRMHEILLENLRTELAAWDGSLEVLRDEIRHQYEQTGRESEDGGNQQNEQTEPNLDQTVDAGIPERTVIEAPSTEKQKIGYLRICVDLDSVAGKVLTYFRCRSNQDFPESGLFLLSKESPIPHNCEEYLPGWSTPVVNSGNGTPIDASRYDWNQQLEFLDQHSGWHLRLQPRPIRIFVSGETEGLPGLIEVNQLFPSMHFYLAVEGPHVKFVKKWGEQDCQDFKEIGITSGLPSTWKFFSSRGAINDSAIRDMYPFLAFSETLSVRLEGGIKSSRGNTFFDFGLPHVVLEGGVGSESVICKCRNEGFELRANPETRSFSLPTGLQSGTELEIEIQRVDHGQSEAIKRRSIYIENEFGWKDFTPKCFFDKFGRIVEDVDTTGIAEALLTKPISARFQPILPAELFEASQIIFVGSAKGQIIFWPDEALQEEWQPVWAIRMKKNKGHALFCGLGMLPPTESSANVHPRKIRTWQEVLWHWRKRIAPPAQRNLQELWKKYQEAAQHAR